MSESGVAAERRQVDLSASSRGGRIGAALAVVALIVLAAMLARWGLLLWDSLHNEAGRYDFSSYYAAAATLRADIHANIYDDALIGRVGVQAHTLVAPPLPYTYPPIFAILLSPFTLISFRVLSRLWLVGNLALWLAITALLAREIAVILGPRLRFALGIEGSRRVSVRGLLADPTPLVALALAALLSEPFAPAIQTLILGQINFLVLLPLALVPELTRRGHERWAGAMIAIAAMLKFTPAILLVYLVLRRRWQAFWAALATLAGLALVSVVIVGPGVFLAAFTQALRVSGVDADLGHNEALLASFLPTSGPLKLVQYLVLGVLLLATAWVLWRGPRPSAPADTHGVTLASVESDTVGFGIALCAVLLVPTAWVHHYVWVSPAAAIALGLAASALLSARDSSERTRAVVLAAVVVLACWALGYALPFNWDTEPSPATTVYLGLPRALWLALRPIGTVALLLVLAYWYRHPVARLAVVAGTVPSANVAVADG